MYTYRKSGEVGVEIISPDGKVVMWATDDVLAAIVVGLLNSLHAERTASWT